ncbi:anhydro-N-acetylmuramic acid kinase [uncultured Aquimarina sp.]|uniref:anhydro-N-acetylmuramic acid kinase n=1 Tax=uncultured Aquimarina sp. TaxID=575652 RepID=UPI002630E9B7|nr:anhydro-N-acetylmuramic acid kinase [uncultured Aquimarina sp.]
MSAFPKTYKVIGLMSGTSLDGLDIAYCHIKKHEDSWTFSIVNTENVAYSEDFKNKLKNTVDLSSMDLLAFHNIYGTWLGKQVTNFINKNSITADFISSHGHTVFHQPEIGLTYQIGSGQHIANTTNLKVICDFRTNDVALGGQGAPLVPIGDQLLFNKYDFCLNLGGISNISFDFNEKRIAYDISPANMLLNLICNSIDLEYDDRGKIARTGELIEELYNNLNDLSYYRDPYPKSLGYEWFVDKIAPIIKRFNEPIENLLYTSVYHITEQITKAIKSTGKEKSSLLVTGGGAKNDFLIEILQQKLQNHATVIIPDENVIDYKEALIFAFMGVLRELNEINCLQSVTGARKDSSSGIIYYPR